MKKTFRLVNVQLWAALGDMLNIGKPTRKKPTMLYTGVLLFAIIMSGLSFFYNFMLGSGLKMYNSLDILPAIMVTVASVTTLMTTIFKVKGTIFSFRDYDLLMSLPVSTSAVVASRLIILYAFNFLFTVILLFPMTIAYGILAKAGIIFYAVSLVLIFIVPLVPLIAASVIGTFIAYIAAKFRHKNLLNIIFSISILLLIIAMPYIFQGDDEALVNIGKAITEKVYSLYPLARLYTNAVVSADWIAFLLLILISVSAFAIYIIIIQLLFKKLNTLMMTGRTRSNFRLGKLKTASPLKALYIKELKRYFSSSIYVLNTAFGMVLITIMAVAGLFVDLDELLGAAQTSFFLRDNIALYLIFCIIMSCTTMASISLEGKNFWIIKSLPVSAMTVFLAKIALNLTICFPALLDALLLGIILKLSFVRTVLLILIAAVCSLFIAMYGLIINLILPYFNWTVEAMAVKKSPATMVTVFSAFLFAAVFFLLISVMPSVTAAYLVYLLFMSAVNVILYIVLNSYGVKRFNSL